MNNKGFNAVYVDYCDADFASIIYSNTFKRLLMILERDMKNVSNFFVVVDGNKITIHIDYYRQVGLFDNDFELCKN